MWMGGWFVATSVGGLLSGAAIGRFWSTKEWPHWDVPHSSFFAFLACSSLIAFAVMLAFLRLVNRAMPAKK